MQHRFRWHQIPAICGAMAKFAAIYLTERNAYCAVGHSIPAYEQSAHNSFIKIPAIDLPRHVQVIPCPAHAEPGSKIPDTLLPQCLSWIHDASGGDLSVIVIGCFGPFVSLEKADPAQDDFGGYGKLQEITTHKGWGNSHIYKISKEWIQRYGKNNTEIRIHTEVDLAALGELWYRRLWLEYIQESDTLKGRAKPYTLGPKEIESSERSIMVFLKISRSINGGITYSGDLWKGRHHPLMSSIRLPRYQMRTASGTLMTDAYPGSCDIHGDCIEGLIGTKAIESRTGFFLENIPSNDGVWELVADYVASLCVAITAIISPGAIVLGGRTVRTPNAPSVLIPRIQELFTEKTSGNGRRSPDYPKMRIPHYIRAHILEHCGIYGGLVMAERWARRH